MNDAIQWIEWARFGVGVMLMIVIPYVLLFQKPDDLQHKLKPPKFQAKRETTCELGVRHESGPRS
jgi:hypothetical protein